MVAVLLNCNLTFWMQTISVLLPIAMAALRKNLQELLTQFFSKSDKNNDESLSPEEVAAQCIWLTLLKKAETQIVVVYEQGHRYHDWFQNSFDALMAPFQDKIEVRDEL